MRTVKPQLPINIGRVLFVLFMFLALMLPALSAWAQCNVGPGNYVSYTTTINGSYPSRISMGGSGSWNLTTSVSAGGLLVITSGTASGTISGDGLICIAEGAALGNMNGNFSGTIRNYSTTNYSTITWPGFTGNIENYGGVIYFNGRSTLSADKHIINFGGGSVIWEDDFNINDIDFYNEGYIYIAGELAGDGCINNQALMSIGSYSNNSDLLNNGAIEILSTKLNFNSTSTINNQCAIYSHAIESNFQNNTSISNSGLIFLPQGTFQNKAGRQVTNGSSGAVVTKNFDNYGTFTGSGRVHVAESSQNRSGGNFYGSGGLINFWDATSSNGEFDYGTAGSSVYYSSTPTPTQSMNLYNYNCNSIVHNITLNGGQIAADQYLCEGQNPVAFTSNTDATCSNINGAIISYQWQQSSSLNGTYIDIQGANQKTYTVPARPANKTYYRRVAKFVFKEAFSNKISITPTGDPLPSINTHPSNAQACVGQSVQFVVSASDADIYQWQQKKGTNSWGDLSDAGRFSGVSTNRLTINNLNDNFNTRKYRVKAINTCGTVNSNAATLSVLPDDTPVITIQPQNQIVCKGEASAQFSIETEQACNYQWQVSNNSGGTWVDISNETDYAGATTAILTVSDNGLVDLALFRCMLSATCESTESDAATLYVISNPEVEVNASVPDKCPDTDPALEFNSVDSNYQMGNSAISFIVTRNTVGPFEWSFSYSLVLSNPGLLVDTQTQGNVEVTDVNTDTHTLTFYIANQTEEIISATLSIDDVEVEGCAESSVGNPNHSATMQVYRMPVIGEFNKE